MARSKPIQPRLPGFDNDFETPVTEEVPDEPPPQATPPSTQPERSFVSRVGEGSAKRDVSPNFTSRVRSRKWQPGLFDASSIQSENLPAQASPPALSPPVRVRRSLFDLPPESEPETPALEIAPAQPSATAAAPQLSSGEKAKARDVLAAIRTMQLLEREHRSATAEEQGILARFSGFGPLALRLFPDPLTGQYKDASWQTLGEELRSLLTPEEYSSAKRTTFNAFYTSPTVIRAIHEALPRLGVPADAHVLEPGCGSGNFLAMAPKTYHFTAVELDSLSGRIAKARHPHQDIRLEDFRDSKLPTDLDAVIGNVPFADVRYEYQGQKLALHDYFLAKSLDSLAPGGILAVVTSHYTMDKQNTAVRERLAESADLLGAIRLPSDAFKTEGTAVVTDILFLRKRGQGEPAQNADEWLTTEPMDIDGLSVPINRYFVKHPEMVLGTWSRENTLYGDGYSITSNGDLAEQLHEAMEHLPRLPTRERVRPPPVRVETPINPTTEEGSFVLGADGRILQRVQGELLPVHYGGTDLASHGSLVGRRLAALIGLRDKARRVLQSQNEGWPSHERDEARRALNRDYDRFVQLWGPINKTTFSETKDGGTIRRMPNLVKFREDPDAMLVLALEDYDETTGQAQKAPIMLRDVVGRTPPIEQVRSAEEGLLVSLDQRGKVDLPLIAQLYGQPESAVLAELGDLVFRDPITRTWLPADEYLSGPVRLKLQQAREAGPEFARNVEALQAVQPEDVLPGDIDANLGAPWIPVADIQQFAADLFRIPSDSITLAHLPKEAVWSLEPNWTAMQSVAASSEFGTDRVNGFQLLEQALNLKTPMIYDTIGSGEQEQRVLNPEATLAAREKQKLIKERFQSWIFHDPDRTERLVRTYNDTYNALRPRQCDGSHLAFPGLATGLQLRPHQRDAVWRGMSGGNTLLAHCVGAGKTFTMAATGMKMKQTGLIRKPMYVVPNHLLEQFGREFLQLYPNAKLLIADKEDFTREKRKFLTAKIASGDWDGIIVTHSSFEKIGLSKDYQAKFLREQIEEYDQLLVDRATRNVSKAHRNLTKTLEKQKARQEAKLKDLLAADKKDDGLVFDELGVDQIFIDEAQAFKNLETPTKLDRVAGIQTGGSERSFDLLMKCRYLDEQHPGQGVTFATGTPVSNTMVELYTLSRYLDPTGLQSRGIDHFDAWAATFGEVVDAMEIAPDGASLKPRSRFAKFVNLPELQQMFRSFADVQTADMLDLPRPKLQGGKAEVIACPMSHTQAQIQESLVARYERIRSSKVDPREDNALAITTDGRKLALDPRLLSPDAEDDPDSKLNALVENVHRIWQESTPRLGTQMIFCDLGVSPTAWGFSVYQDIIVKLVARGIPASQIAEVGDADTDAKKQALFEKVRSGNVRVLLGSTMKMGAGTNVQKRLVALHHLDAPWKPAEVEQREGRILRQGNTNSEVAIYRYVTERSFDSYLWQALETKAKFIGQVMTGRSGVRKADDVGGQELSYAEVKAIASGNPAVLTLAETEAEVQRLSVLRRGHADEQFLARRAVRELPNRITHQETHLKQLNQDWQTVQQSWEGLLVRGRAIPEGDAVSALSGVLESVPEHVDRPRQFPLGQFHGLKLLLEKHPNGAADVVLQGEAEQFEALSKESQGPRAVWNALNRLADSFEERLSKSLENLQLMQNQLRDYHARLGQPFIHAERLELLSTLRDQLKMALASPSANTTEAIPDSEALVNQLTSQLKVALQANELRPLNLLSQVRIVQAHQPKIDETVV
jgi:N12 class adenine-specific DNA methylase